ncbi:MAG: LuxR C-terminal-related transcriptional regulator [Sphingomonadaceae bacterium]
MRGGAGRGIVPVMEQRLIIHIVDSSSRTRAELSRMAFELGHHAEVYADLAELGAHPPRDGLVLARDLPEAGGAGTVLDDLAQAGIWLPLVAFGENPTTGRVVEAVKAGALDYLMLPVDPAAFARTLERINGEARVQAEARRRMIEARGRIASLSNREREVLDCLAEGGSNKAIARALEISPRTVEIHRANMMGKLGAKHAAEAVRLRMEAQLEPPAMERRMSA